LYNDNDACSRRLVCVENRSRKIVNRKPHAGIYFFKVRQTLNPSRHEAIGTLGNIISSMDVYKMFTIDYFSRISEVILALLVLHRKGA
jgi:hypothetical protein